MISEVGVSELMTKYNKEIRAALQKELGLGNTMEVPRLMKIVVSFGIKATDKDKLNDLVREVGAITGQAPLVIKAKKSISNFKLRAGMPIGAKVTMRGKRMYDFVTRLVHAALPRIRDFRGLPKDGFDGRGNYNIGVDEQTVFPEINPDDVKFVHGLNISIVTSALSDAHACALLQKLGVPIADQK